MSLGARGKTTRWLRDTIAAMAQAEREAMFGEMTGTVVSFDPASQTATVQPDYKPRHNGTEIDMPQLKQVPVRFPKAGGFVVTTPVKEGDKVAIRPQMRSTDKYHSGEGYADAGSTRSFSLSDYEAFLDGGEPVSEPISDFNAENVEIRTADGQFKIEMSPDGKFNMTGAEGNVVDLLATTLELLAAEKLNILVGSSAGQLHEMQYKSEYTEIAAKLRGMVIG